jgi:uncharacterized membrane protein
MSPDVIEWLHLILRWTHVFVVILWLGQTYFFTKLDGRLGREEAESVEGQRPQVWLIHSGGFYVVERDRSPKTMPKRLHWFRWEAAATWISGFLLLGLLYYSDGLLLDASVSQISMGRAVVLGISVLVLGWVIYDILWLSPLGRNPVVGGCICFAAIVALSYALTRVMSGRAAYIHIGSLFGTIMAANVWMRILPAQRKMLAAVRLGQTPDPSLAARAKARSKHNTFMALPVVFLMISNHFPAATYGQSYGWLILSALVLIGGLSAKIIYAP